MPPMRPDALHPSRAQPKAAASMAVARAAQLIMIRDGATPAPAVNGHRAAGSQRRDDGGIVAPVARPHIGAAAAQDEALVAEIQRRVGSGRELLAETDVDLPAPRPGAARSRSRRKATSRVPGCARPSARRRRNSAARRCRGRRPTCRKCRAHRARQRDRRLPPRAGRAASTVRHASPCPSPTARSSAMAKRIAPPLASALQILRRISASSLARHGFFDKERDPQ